MLRFQHYSLAFLAAIVLHGLVLYRLTGAIKDDMPDTIDSVHVISLNSYTSEESSSTDKQPSEQEDSVRETPSNNIRPVHKKPVDLPAVSHKPNVSPSKKVMPKPVTQPAIKAPYVAQLDREPNNSSQWNNPSTSQKSWANPNGYPPGAKSGDSAQANLSASYLKMVGRLLQQHKQYPRSAMRRRQEGTVHLSFTLSSKGEVMEYKITSSSGFDTLDRMVLSMLKKASPLPPFPKEMQQETISLVVPVVFSLY